MDRRLLTQITVRFGYSVLTVYFAAIVVISCSGSQESNNLSILVDTLHIPISSRQLSTYYTSTSFTTSEGADCFVGYNHTAHSLDFFDLNQGRFIRSLQLEYEGPNGIPSFGSFAANKDWIAIISGNTIIYLLDHQGQVIHKVLFDQIEGADGLGLGPSEPVTGNYSKKLLTRTDQLILPTFQFMKRSQPGFYDFFKVLTIDISQSKLSFSWHPLHFPPPFQEALYGDFDIPYLSEINRKVYINFPMSSEVVSLDRFSDSEFEPVSQPLTVKEYNDFGGARFDHFFHSGRYYYPVHDPSTHTSYIVSKEETNPNENTGIDASRLKYYGLSLHVLDDKLNPINSIPIPETVTPLYEITEEGLVFPFNTYHIPDESHISFYRVAIKR